MIIIFILGLNDEILWENIFVLPLSMFFNFTKFPEKNSRVVASLMSSPIRIKTLPITFMVVMFSLCVPKKYDINGETNIVMIISVEKINDVFRGVTYL